MIADLKPYPAMKDSGVEWLGEVPEHWETVAVKRRYSIQLGKMLQTRASQSTDMEVPYLKAQHVQWFSVRTADAPKMWASHNDVDQFGLREGDLLVCEGGEGGRCGLVKEVDSGYIIQNALHRVRASGSCRNDYLQYVMSSVAATGWFNAINNKATIAHFTREKLGSLTTPIPPLPEQVMIVRYLDHVDRRVQRLVRAKQKLIALLGEQKQAIIHRAVTRGLDPDVPLKDSGVEWLGTVPSHWATKRFKFVARVASGQVDPRLAEHKTKVLVAPNHIRTGSGEITRLETADEQGAESGKYEVRQGQVIYSKIRPNLRKAAIAPVDCLCSADMYPLSVRTSELRAEFLLLLLLSEPFTKYAVDCSMRVAMPKVNREALGECLLWYPHIHEQDEILRFVDFASKPIAVAIDRAHSEIELLREYKTCLIADVVTGKLNVRKAAAKLPEETDEVEPFDEAADLMDDVDDMVEDLNAMPEEVTG